MTESIFIMNKLCRLLKFPLKYCSFCSLEKAIFFLKKLRNGARTRHKRAYFCCKTTVRASFYK